MFVVAPIVCFCVFVCLVLPSFRRRESWLLYLNHILPVVCGSVSLPRSAVVGLCSVIVEFPGYTQLLVNCNFSVCLEVKEARLHTCDCIHKAIQANITE